MYIYCKINHYQIKTHYSRITRSSDQTTNPIFTNISQLKKKTNFLIGQKQQLCCRILEELKKIRTNISEKNW